MHMCQDLQAELRNHASSVLQKRKNKKVNVLGDDKGRLRAMACKVGLKYLRVPFCIYTCVLPGRYPGMLSACVPDAPSFNRWGWRQVPMRRHC